MGRCVSFVQMKHYGRKKEGHLFVPIEAQQLVVEFANGFEVGFELAIVGDPVFDLRELLGLEADLFVLAAGVADGENRDGVAFTTSTLGTALAVANGALEQRTAHRLSEIGQLRHELLPLARQLLPIHLHI